MCCSILKPYIILDYEDKYFQHVAEIYYIQADGTGRGIHINGSARCANYQGMLQLFEGGEYEDTFKSRFDLIVLSHRR
jgi:hypothetical protein